MKRQFAIYLLLSVYIATGVVTIFLFDGTGDTGDSIYHYLFARYAPAHPSLYLNHWAKPLFTLISSPYAQFGFTGMKVFNLTVSAFTMLLTYRIALLSGMKNPLLAALFIMVAPLWYILTFSGLTEPLFALFLAGALLLVLRKQYTAAAVVVSFMPFIRSEGLIVIGVFALYYALSGRWRTIPFLALGHLLFAAVGYLVYHDLLWVFNRMPYASLAPKHGSGPLLHFVFQMNYVVGVPLYMMLVAGLLSYPLALLRKNVTVTREEGILVVGGFLVYLTAHSLFWYFGVFNSMGLKRVLLGVMPLISLIALQGFNLITQSLLSPSSWPSKIAATLIIAYLVIFPFTGNPAAVLWGRDMYLAPEQRAAKAVAAYIHSQNPNPENRFFYTHPYLSEVLHVDHFDSLRRLDCTPWFLDSLKEGDYVIWDNWFAVVESYSTLDTLLNQPGIVIDTSFTVIDDRREVRFVVARKEPLQ